MPTLSRSAKLYQERRIPEDQPTLRLPGPRFARRTNLAHQIPLLPPFPTVDALFEEGRSPPEGGLTDAWPHESYERF